MKIAGKLTNQQIGRFGEELAKCYLENLGYRIVKCNWRCRFGEVDIIAQFKGVLYFVEVKTRTKLTSGYPKDAIDYQKLDKLQFLIDEFIMRLCEAHSKGNSYFQIDYSQNLNKIDCRLMSLSIIAPFDLIDTYEQLPMQNRRQFAKRALVSVKINYEVL